MELFTGKEPAVRVVEPETGHFQWCHTQKEIDKWTKSKDEGGPGYVMNWKGAEYPKSMSHPEHVTVNVANAVEEKKFAKLGYNFDHWDNKQAKAAPEAGAAASFDPKAQSDIALLQARNDALTARLDALMAKLGA